MSRLNYGEIGNILQKITLRLLENQELLKLLYVSNNNPLQAEPLSKEIIRNEIMGKLIKVVPRVSAKIDDKSILVIKVVEVENNENFEFSDIIIEIQSFVPLNRWAITGDNLRPFSIMEEISNSLRDKNIKGYGKLKENGMSLSLISDEISCYTQQFSIVEFN